MGYHNLPPSYDTTRTTPPEDLRPAKLFYPDTVRAPLTIVTDLVAIEAVGIYDTGTRFLCSVEIDGEQFSLEQVETSFKVHGSTAESGWSDRIDKDYANALINDAIDAYEH